METIIVCTHGASTGDPGPAAVGVQVVDERGTVLKEVSETIGNGTSVYAAYHAVLRGLQLLIELYGDATIQMAFELRLDNEGVKTQLNHEQPVTDPGLVPLFMEIHNLRVANFPHLTLIHVKREKNKEADRLVNEALDDN